MDSQRWPRPRILGVFAHPDDETFCAGGTLAKYIAAGWEVMVISATRGQAGQIHDPLAATRQTLGQAREREFYAACERLGVHHALVWDYMDGALQEVAPDVLVADVARIIGSFRPDVVITFGPDGAYGHPDHIAIGAATTRAYEQLGSSRRFRGQPLMGRSPERRIQLYHSYFPQNRLLLRDSLAHWLAASVTRFQGTAEFTRALPLFAVEATTLRYASDHVDVEWFPSGAHIIEQNEPGAKLYLLLSGQVDVIQDNPDGTQTTLRRLGPGEFFGELAIVHQRPRAAHVVAAGNVTCLVLAPGAPSAFAGRGAGAHLAEGAAAERIHDERAGGVIVPIDISGYVGQKMAAVAAHRTQYPIAPDMLPIPLLQELFGMEYFIRVHPSSRASIQSGEFQQRLPRRTSKAANGRTSTILKGLR